MIQIPLQVVPNQKLKLSVSEELYDITIRTTDKASFITISRDNIELIKNQIIIPNTEIIQYNYLKTNGNFIFSTNNDELVDYIKFNETQSLYYATNDELENG